ncbi:MAG: PilZ domain-containing protein [Methyloligellaceae bacterium]
MNETILEPIESNANPPYSLRHDRRRHFRVKLKLLGRMMRENKQEYPCKLMNISPGGAALLSPVEGQVGEHIVAYIDQVGRIDGTIVRCFDGGFALGLSASDYKRDKLADQLTWIVNSKSMGLPEERRHERIIPKTPHQTLHVDEADSIDCQVIDVSVSGASIMLENRPQVGKTVTLGRMRGRVVRHHDSGIGIEFLNVQSESDIKSSF